MFALEMTEGDQGLLDVIDRRLTFAVVTETGDFENTGKEAVVGACQVVLVEHFEIRPVRQAVVAQKTFLGDAVLTDADR